MKMTIIKVTSKKFNDSFRYGYSSCISISDIAFTVSALFQESLSEKDVHKADLEARKFQKLLWLLLGFLLSLGYCATLPSFLISIRYEDSINTISDQEQSDARLIIIKYSPMEHLISTDPRPPMQKIYNRSISLVFDGTLAVPKWITDMY